MAEYYAPCARKRWCVSQYDKVGHNAFGIFPQTARVSSHSAYLFSLT